MLIFIVGMHTFYELKQPRLPSIYVYLFKLHGIMPENFYGIIEFLYKDVDNKDTH